MRLRRPGYADVMSTVGVFIALGGTSYAVIKLPKNSVGSRQVKDRSLKRADLAAGVVPKAVRGPRGAQGPQGVGGDRGPSDVITASRNGVTISTTGPTSTDVVTLNNVPPGKWWVLASTSAVYEGSGAVGSDYFRCGLTFGGESGRATSVARVGLDGIAAAAAVLTVHEGRELSAPTSIRLRCGHDLTLPSGVPRFDHAQITAIRTANLEIQGG